MEKLAGLLLIAFFGYALVSCDKGTTEEDRYSENREKWEQKNIQNYKYTYEYTHILGEKEIVTAAISSKAVEYKVYVNSKPIGGSPAVDLNFIEQFFDIVAQELKSNGSAAVRVSYNSDYGYPESAYFNSGKAGYGFSLYEFTVNQ